MQAQWLHRPLEMPRGNQGITSPSAPPVGKEPWDFGRAEDNQDNKLPLAGLILQHRRSSDRYEALCNESWNRPKQSKNELRTPGGSVHRGGWEVQILGMVSVQGNTGWMLLPGSGCSPVPAHHTEPAAQQTPVRASQPVSAACDTVTNLLPPHSQVQTPSFTCNVTQVLYKIGGAPNARPTSRVSPCARHGAGGTGGKLLIQGRQDGGVTMDREIPHACAV